MKKQEIIARVQAGQTDCETQENIYIPMTPAQFKARKDSYSKQQREHRDCIESRAHCGTI